MPVQIHITGENAQEAIQEFSVLSAAFVGAVAPTPAPVVQAPATPQPPIDATPAQPSTVPTQPQYGQQAPSGQQSQYGQPPQQGYGQAPSQPTGAVPTSGAPQYTIDQIGVAVQPLLDGGAKQGQLLGWLQQRGVGALTELNPQYYGEFATFIRGLGARI